jgi:hypothetical protein
MTDDPQPTNILSIGPDKLLFAGESVIICAAREIADWEVREFCRPAIYFQNKKYFLKQKFFGEAPNAFHYELAPWPSNVHEESKLSFTYDESFVADRDRQFRCQRGDEWVRYILLPCYPVLGFLWSGFKERVLSRFGFNAVSLTGVSLLLSFCLFLLEAIFILCLGGGFAEIVLNGLAWSSGTFDFPVKWLDYFRLFCLLRVAVRCRRAIWTNPARRRISRWVV